MLNRLNFGKRSAVIPNLVIAQRAIDKMIAASKHYLADETGEAMMGLILENLHTGIPTLYVLDTISPDESAIRHFHTFQQGDDRQDEILWWMRENWRVYNKQFVEQIAADNPLKQRLLDAPLHYLGDWHKQPGHMVQPSNGDLMTALEWIHDAGEALGFMLAPILTLDHPNVEEASGVTTNFLSISNGDGTNTRIDFWYINQKLRGFAPITPTVYQDKDLPTLPPYPWHLVDQARYDEECDLLTAEGMFLSVTLWDGDGKPPLEVCFLVAHPDSEKLLIIVTSHDYPTTPPSIRLAPFININPDDDMYDVFEEAWQRSEVLTDDAPSTWEDADRLVNLVRAVEEKHNLRVLPPPQEKAEADTPSEAQEAVAAVNLTDLMNAKPVTSEADTPNETPTDKSEEL